MKDSMHTKDFLQKVNYEGLGYALTGYFGPEVKLHGPCHLSLAEAWRRASVEVRALRKKMAEVCEDEGWDLEC